MQLKSEPASLLFPSYFAEALFARISKVLQAAAKINAVTQKKASPILTPKQFVSAKSGH
jgi:hypothetical protein